MKAFQDYKIKNLTLKNRFVLAPMCMYSSEDGLVNDFHLNHYASRAMGGVGLIIVEATGITPNGRITDRDLGIWDDKYIDGLSKLVDNCHDYGSKVAIQLAHAGRKSTTKDSFIVAPSALPFSPDYRLPKELTKDEIKDIVLLFKEAAIRADKAGFDLIEIHAAHGYLLHEFLSPLSNKRQDDYGGSLVNRTRFLKEVLEEVSKVWPENKAISLRVSASDYLEGGIDKYMMADIIGQVKDLVDLVHVSTGGLINTPIDTYPGYQVKHCEFIREKSGLPSIAVGLIESYEQAEEIISNERADLVALGRELLRNPYFVNNAAYENKLETFPKAYEMAYKK